jgi:hypothetical protein
MRLERAGEDDRLAGDRAGRRRHRFERLRRDFGKQPPSICWLCSSAKNSTSASATVGPTPSIASSSCQATRSSPSGFSAARHRRLQGLERAVMARQQSRIGLADMADAEREDEAVERGLAPVVDRLEQLLDRWSRRSLPCP